ncbi:sensor histidine kinase [Lacrimispora saccharolytica]|uniref:Signal transduction histidine kinase, LytS n=1 Tax=Lacrimispora saccharolytica (strain ATCC 35040 / DSM 2544 / NRCC 2533 / WM1) TaxID=610130 RepID=D9R4U1_LACSW|nr:sensor histidine kinase [Lacrimispora saccharolytica]ADL03275.1 signal transduction histidine kinase, LytS [[Clostridium] saccharolyticum WM1]QRV18557.1 sensor histidine kinase [Lacrimispora saccharolytica]
MKKGRYFKEELRRLILGYAIIPAAGFTLICTLVFLAVLLYGKKSGNEIHNAFVAAELERALMGYEEKLAALSGSDLLLTAGSDAAGRRLVFEEFYRMSGQLGYKAELYVFDGEKQVILSTRKEIPEYLSDREGVNWGLFGAMDKTPGETRVRLMEAWKGSDRDIAMGIAMMREGKTAGYLVFTINSSQLGPVLDRSDSQTIIADRFGRVYLSSNYNLVNSSNQVMKALKLAGRYLPHDKKMYLVSVHPAYHRMFLVYSVTDIQNIVVSLGLSSALIISALVLMTIWVLISTKKVTERETRDFYRLLHVMEMARDGNLETSLEIESENEFRIIADAYRETIASLKLQMENNRRMTELVAAAQNKQLESQFNPHFLFNTLENIRYMCLIQPETAGKMVFSLSNLLRYSLDGGRAEVTLEEDLEHLENYLMILKYRFNRRFSYVVDVEEPALTCRIPRLVLQPMIENSVKYGFGNQENLKVELKAYIHEDRLIMICRDDGIGMTPGVLCEIQALLEQEENNRRHSGLYNIHRRCRILYGRPYGVEIRSAEGLGTTLVVTLPVQREES